jgi:hypothetical protein
MRVNALKSMATVYISSKIVDVLNDQVHNPMRCEVGICAQTRPRMYLVRSLIGNEAPIHKHPHKSISAYVNGNHGERAQLDVVRG